jgi:hypothetical protein
VWAVPNDDAEAADRRRLYDRQMLGHPGRAGAPPMLQREYNGKAFEHVIPVRTMAMSSENPPRKSRDLPTAEFQRVVALPPQERYAYFVERVANTQQIWSLRTRSGWVTMGDDAAGQILPVWPHSRFAETFIGENWAEAQVTGITLRDWVDRRVPGMIKQGTRIAVFPVTTTAEGAVVTEPERLQWDLQRAAEQYE